MSTWLTPDAVNGLTGGTLVVIAAILVVIASAKGWIVFRWQYQSEIAMREAKNAEQTLLIAEIMKARAIDAETIRTQAETIRDNNATGEGALKMLQTFRELTAGGNP